MQLRRLVFPAPFGPMIPVMEPRCTARSTPARARTPPNESEIPSTERIWSSGAAVAGAGRIRPPGGEAVFWSMPVGPARAALLGGATIYTGTRRHFASPDPLGYSGDDLKGSLTGQ